MNYCLLNEEPVTSSLSSNSNKVYTLILKSDGAVVLLISVILLNILELKVKKNEMNEFIEAWDILYLLDILYLRYRYIYGGSQKKRLLIR
jgi:hypothetical protein